MSTYRAHRHPAVASVVIALLAGLLTIGCSGSDDPKNNTGGQADATSADVAVQFGDATEQDGALEDGSAADSDVVSDNDASTPDAVVSDVVDDAGALSDGEAAGDMTRGMDTGEPPAGTCEGRCGVFVPSAGCQCDPDCEEFGDCCPDYDALCISGGDAISGGDGESQVDPDAGSTDSAGDDATVSDSCVGRCGLFIQGAPCQCNGQCAAAGTCCADYDTVCTGCTDGASCDDGLACTTDTCDSASGQCQYAIAPGNCLIDGACYADGEGGPSCKTCAADDDNEAWSIDAGASCDDGNPCTTGEVCSAAGVCEGQTSASCCKDDADCDDGDPCTTDSCDKVAGTCDAAPIAGCCTTGVCCDAVNQSVLTGTGCGEQVVSEEFQCTDKTIEKRTAFAGCTGQSGDDCSTAPADLVWGDWQAVQTCGDGQSCVVTGDSAACKDDNAAQCSAAAECDDGNPCTADTCEGGQCQSAAIAGCCQFDSDCGDGNPCTTDSCGANNTCSNVTKTCPGGSDCEMGACDPATGGCVLQIKPDSCKIGDVCYSDGDKDPQDSCQVCDADAASDGWSLTSFCACDSGSCCDVADGKIHPKATKCDDQVQAEEYACSDDGTEVQVREAFRGCTGKSNTCSVSKSNWAWGAWKTFKTCGADAVCEVGDASQPGTCQPLVATPCTPGTTCCTSAGAFESKGTACGADVVATEYGCSSSLAGSDVRKREAVAGCTGTSTTCSTAKANLVWGDWKVELDCKKPEKCEVADPDQMGQCVSPSACDPADACCGADGQLSADGTQCGNSAVQSEYQCDGQQLQKRDAFGGCTGEASTCSFAAVDLVWGAWATEATCGSDELCVVDDPAQPGTCKAKPDDTLCNKADAYEGGTSVGSAHDLGSFDDDDPAVFLSPKVVLGSSSDTDWLRWNIADVPNLTDPRVQVEWTAAAPVKVCAYYRCNEGLGGEDCEPIACPVGSTPSFEPNVSLSNPNGCCATASAGEIAFFPDVLLSLDESGTAFARIENAADVCQEVSAKVVFGADQQTPCDPNATCCDATGNFESAGTACGAVVLGTEYQCGAGGDVEARTAVAGCGGSSTVCSADGGPWAWSDWAVFDACGADEVCSVTDKNVAGVCKPKSSPICNVADAYEAGTTTAKSHILGTWNDSDPAVVLDPKVVLGASDDKDYLVYQILDGFNLTDPEVNVSWDAGDLVTVCAYYQCSAGAGAQDCDPVQCPADSTPFFNSTVSLVSPNGCCRTAQSGQIQFEPNTPFDLDETGWAFFNVKNAGPVCQYVNVKLAFGGSTAACGDGVCDSGEANSCPEDCGSCQGACGQFQPNAPCQCDSACAQFGDCCWDLDLVCAP